MKIIHTNKEFDQWYDLELRGIIDQLPNPETYTGETYYALLRYIDPALGKVNHCKVVFEKREVDCKVQWIQVTERACYC